MDQSINESIFQNGGLNISREIGNLGQFAQEVQVHLSKGQRDELARAVVRLVRHNAGEHNALQIIIDHMEETCISSLVHGTLSYWIAHTAQCDCHGVDLYNIICAVDHRSAHLCEHLLKLERKRKATVVEQPSDANTEQEGTTAMATTLSQSPSPSQRWLDQHACTTKTAAALVLTDMNQAQLDEYYVKLSGVLDGDDQRRLANILLQQHFPIGSTAASNVAREQNCTPFQAMMSLWLKKQQPHATGEMYCEALASFNQRSARLSAIMLGVTLPSTTMS
ncbi:uncharacterized protein LOC135830952 [Sycon ciliatum]|uniref:uncharacterized protein LOC135830952 n=1 Tax=Sycon ciliatum TaxID=27933 RepID=UPI0031F61802